MCAASLFRAGMILAVLGTGGACGGSNPAAPSGGSTSAQGLAGTWRATRAEFVNRANSSIRVEVVSLGATLVFTLDAAGTYTRTLTPVGDPPNVQTGSWSASRDVLTLRPTDITGAIQFDYALSGNSLSLTGGHVLFDVDDNGTLEEAVLNAAFTRQ